MRKYALIVSAIAAMAISCNKISDPVAECTQVRLDINVGSLVDETKAVKTNWTEGDKISLWLDGAKTATPTAVLTYDGSEWTSSLVLSSSLLSEGKICALYESTNDLSQYNFSVYGAASKVEFPVRTVKGQVYTAAPMVAGVSQAAYVYDSAENVLKADLSESWNLPTKVQFVISDLPEGYAAEDIALSISSANRLYFNNWISLSDGIYFNTSARYSSEWAYGLPNEDGAAFCYTRASGDTEVLVINMCDLRNGKTCSMTKNINVEGKRSYKISYNHADWEVTDEGDGYLDLSADGTANSYVIDASADKYCFNALVCGNGQTVDGLDAPAALSPASASLVWQTSKGMISDVDLVDGYVRFVADETPGNALIAVKDRNGSIIWSWHIWHPAEAVSGINADSGYTVMNMNLGAMNSGRDDILGTYGLLYQWGRKDPFPGSPTVTGTTQTVPVPVYDENGNTVSISNSSWYNNNNNTIAYSVANPTVVLSNYSQYSTLRDWLKAEEVNDALWGNPQGGERDIETNTYPNKGSKTYYDPCPAGWRVPPVDVFSFVTASGGYEEYIPGFRVADVNNDGAISAADFTYGWTFILADGAESFFPATARYDGSYGMLYGSVAGMWGNYWGNAPYGNGLGWGVLSYQARSLSPNAGGSKADAYAVRCVREN